MDINLATVQDIQGMISVRHSTWLDTYPNEEHEITTEDLEKKLEEMHKGEVERWSDRITNDPSCRAWVAKEDNKVVAFASVQKQKDQNKIWSLYVLSAFQNKGVGRKLLETIFEWLGTDKKIILEVASYNKKAINFYKSYGFVKHGQVSNPVGSLPSGKTIPETLMIKESSGSTCS